MNRRHLLTAGALGASGLALASAAAAQAQPSSGFAFAPSTFDRVKESGVLKVTVMRGQEPYFHKDPASGQWSGACVEMTNNIAKVLNVKPELVETANWGTSVLDLQSGKVDLAFGVSPTPARGLVFDFPSPVFMNFYTVVTRKGFGKVDTWEQINLPSVSVAVDLGSGQEAIARRFLPNANIRAFKDHDEMLMNVATGRIDCCLLAIFLAIKAAKLNSAFGEYYVPKPFLAVPSCMAVRIDQDKRMRDFLSVWADYNHGLGLIREWMGKGLADLGIPASAIPSEITI